MQTSVQHGLVLVVSDESPVSVTLLVAEKDADCRIGAHIRLHEEVQKHGHSIGNNHWLGPNFKIQHGIVVRVAYNESANLSLVESFPNVQQLVFLYPDNRNILLGQLVLLVKKVAGVLILINQDEGIVSHGLIEQTLRSAEFALRHIAHKQERLELVDLVTLQFFWVHWLKVHWSEDDVLRHMFGNARAYIVESCRLCNVFLGLDIFDRSRLCVRFGFGGFLFCTTTCRLLAFLGDCLIVLLGLQC